MLRGQLGFVDEVSKGEGQGRENTKRKLVAGGRKKMGQLAHPGAHFPLQDDPPARARQICSAASHAPASLCLSCTGILSAPLVTKSVMKAQLTSGGSLGG